MFRAVKQESPHIVCFVACMLLLLLLRSRHELTSQSKSFVTWCLCPWPLLSYSNPSPSPSFFPSGLLHSLCSFLSAPPPPSSHVLSVSPGWARLQIVPLCLGSVWVPVVLSLSRRVQNEAPLTKFVLMDIKSISAYYPRVCFLSGVEVSLVKRWSFACVRIIKSFRSLAGTKTET